MIIKEYDKVLLSNGLTAFVVESFGDGWFLADINKDDDIETEEIHIDEIVRVL